MNLISILYGLMCCASTIKNSNYPICKSCAYFLNPVDETKRGSYEFGKCNLFGVQNVVSGEIKYEFAEICRTNQYKCNMTGKYYKEKVIQ